MNDGWLWDSILKTAEPAADVDRAGVLAGSLQHARPRRRQLLEMDARALVAAVLGPHHGEDADSVIDGSRPSAFTIRSYSSVSGRGARGARRRSSSCCRPDGARRRERLPPIRRAPDRRRCRASARTRVPGAASCRRRCGARCRFRRCSARRRSDSKPPRARRSRRRRSGRSPGDRARARRARRRARSSCPRRLIGMLRIWPGRAGRGERRIDLFDAHVTWSQMNLRPRFRSIAPGRARTRAGSGNPLQTPSTGPPASAKALTAAITGETRDSAGPQVVPVREAAGEDDHVSRAGGGVLCRRTRLLAKHVLRGVVGVVVAIRSGKDDDGEFHYVRGPSVFQASLASSLDFAAIRLGSPGWRAPCRATMRRFARPRVVRWSSRRPWPSTSTRNTCPAGRRRRRCSPASAARRRWSAPGVEDRRFQ